MHELSRRHFLASLAAAPALAAPAPASPVSVARCRTYEDNELTPTLQRMFDQLGGLGRLVSGKTVTIKINLTGGTRDRMGTTPAEDAQYTHPAVAGAVVRLMDKAGARRIRIVEGCYACSDPLEEFMLDVGWDPAPLLNAGRNVEMENTNVLGRGRRYHRLMTPGGGYIFPGFDLNHAYDECDVMVSLAKMKEHATCGITLAMKNMFGVTPITIYGDHAGKDEPALEAKGGRGVVMHRGSRGPSKSAPQENDPASPRDDRYRIPRIVTDICAARPVHLSIIDGVKTMAGGEGPWIRRVTAPAAPGLLVAGLNPVCTDSVAAALMGFDPMAERGTAPFEHCDSTLSLAEAKGLGTRDLKRIEVIGVPIKDAVHPFRKYGPGPWGRAVI
jgi:uncharacterized protein (DUF362 family)